MRAQSDMRRLYFVCMEANAGSGVCYVEVVLNGHRDLPMILERGTHEELM